ncbi:hypothetical protein GCM10009630_34820 [Kribbella jejuensis]|nr:sigma factor [Kribbella jejuensis]
MEELRPLLLSIAYRMLGTFGDAEDVVQEAYLRLHREPEVTSPKSFLTTVTTRLAIDQLRSARRQREQYFGPWLPEPAVDEYVDLADRAALSEVRRFVAAAEDGELDALVALLTPDATFTGDGGGKGGFPRPVHGAGNVARLVIGAFGKFRGLATEPVHIGGQPALRIHDAADRTVAVWSFVVTEGRIDAVHGVVNPDKLTHVQPSRYSDDQG